MTIVAAADGSALGNPGPAGWAWYIDESQWRAGGWKHATNNQAELMAVLSLLIETAEIETPLHILCDSQYVINALTKWRHGWKKKGWRKSDGKPVLNRELIEQLDEALEGRKITFEWVRGHTGHTMNERADDLARDAATAFSARREPNKGPGFDGGAIISKSSMLSDPDSAAPMLFDSFEEPEPSPQEQDLALVLQSEKRLAEAFKAKETARIQALVHSSFELVEPTGVLSHSRAQAIASLQQTASTSDATVPLSAKQLDTGSVHTITQTGGTSPSVITSLWVKEQGGYRLRLRQHTLVKTQPDQT